MAADSPSVPLRVVGPGPGRRARPRTGPQALGLGRLGHWGAGLRVRGSGPRGTGPWDPGAGPGEEEGPGCRATGPQALSLGHRGHRGAGPRGHGGRAGAPPTWAPRGGGRSPRRRGYLAGVRDLLPGRRGLHPEAPGGPGQAPRRRASPAQQPEEGHRRRHLSG